MKKTIILVSFLSLAGLLSAADVIVFDRPDGGVGIISLAKKSVLTVRQVAKKDVPAGARFKIVEESLIPTDEFRNAWTFDTKSASGIRVNMTKAREIVRLRLRELMSPLLEDAAFSSPADEVALKAKFHAILNAPEIEMAGTEAELLSYLDAAKKRIAE